LSHVGRDAAPGSGEFLAKQIGLAANGKLQVLTAGLYPPNRCPSAIPKELASWQTQTYFISSSTKRSSHWL
jgi:hypothetical protein